MRKSIYITIPIALVMLAFAGLSFRFAFFHSSTAPATSGDVPAGTSATRTLVIISPGMTGNAEFWPDVVPQKATFASELQRGAGEVTLYSYLWNGGWDYASRESAARQLASLIDEKSAAGFNRICLVGHSFGGDICLRASGLCKARIDMVICLATPHTYLTMLSADNHPLEVPVYCSWESRQNIRALINLYPENDASLVDLANAFRAWELSETQAIPLTQSWQEHLGFPRLANDSFEKHLLGREPNLAIADYLNVADVDIKTQSFVARGAVFEFAEHQAFHSRRIGYVLGELIRDGATPSQITSLKFLVQPADADNGNAIPQAQQQQWLDNHNKEMVRAGWRLTKISVTLLPDANRLARNLDRSVVSPMLKITTGTNRKGHTIYQSRVAPNTMTVTWQPDFVLWNGQTDCLSILAHHDILPSDDLGNIPLECKESPLPQAVAADPGNGRFWSARCDWEPVHF